MRESRKSFISLKIRGRAPAPDTAWHLEAFVGSLPVVTGTGETVLVTGGGGFIGSHLAERLLRDGYSVRVLDNFATGRRENLAPIIDEVELIEGDIQSYERAHTAVRGCKLVFHL